MKDIIFHGQSDRQTDRHEVLIQDLVVTEGELSQGGGGQVE